MTDTPEQLLQFAVRFAKTNLDEARPGDWSNLRDDLGWVFGIKRAQAQIRLMPAGTWIFLPAPQPWAMSDKELRKLQAATLTLLEHVADTKAGRKESPIPLGFRTTSEKLPCLSDGGLAFLVKGKPYDLFLELLFMHLAKAGTVRPVLRCPECDDLFYRIRKQKFCSNRCVRKSNWRDYIRTPDGKAAKRRSDLKRRKKAANERAANRRSAR